MDNLERTHSYQRLLMAVVEVDRNIPVIDTGHIGIEYSGGKFCISFFSGKPVKEAASRAIPMISRFRLSMLRPVLEGCTLSLGGRAGHCYRMSHFLQHHHRMALHLPEGTSVGGECATRTGIANGGCRRFFTSGMVEGFTFYIYIRSMRLPIHGKT